jgi:hypothetical protein
VEQKGLVMATVATQVGSIIGLVWIVSWLVAIALANQAPGDTQATKK